MPKWFAYESVLLTLLSSADTIRQSLGELLMVDEGRLYQAVGERIRKIRVSAGAGALTQAELAKLVGLERTSITNIEKGNQKVSLHTLFRICEALKVSVADTLPALTDVQSAEAPTEEFSFANESVETTPLVKQAVFAVLNRSS